MHKPLSCTSILVGKDATIDGSTIIARNGDWYNTCGPKKLVVRPARNKPDNLYVSPLTHVRIPLPSRSYRYICEPSTCVEKQLHLPPSKYPVYEEAGVNEKDVAMSATETTYTNQRFLGCDPYVKHGVNEESMVTIVLPFVNTAREGVRRLGDLIQKYGTGQSNGIAFSDHDEVWYLETVGGHHWAAVRIPDDAYAIAPNETSIEQIDFNDPDHYMYSPDLKSFVEQNHLNPDQKGFNFRKIAGTAGEYADWDNQLDIKYNTSRAWYGHLLFSPHEMKSLGLTDQPTSQKIPFIMKPEQKLTVEDCEYFLSSHYQQTPYDPVKLKKPIFRPVALDRNQLSHVIQLRNDVPKKYSALMWVAMGLFAFSPYVPFYANITRTPKNYATATSNVSLDSAFWLYKTLSALVNPHYHQFVNTVNLYKKKCQAYDISRIKQTDRKASKLDDNQLQTLLTKSSCQTADHITNITKQLIDKIIKNSLNSPNLYY
ncbi:C69 family dipeptidase [Acetilactobacillus jinshanensis]|uniref:Dipeptidase n=1 Tax=Acetilactobacillus jinshanensis TaxID=1720083 RepID=A0A4P6ZLF2_9LACO|nr:C69 family dipeptidase [Acetilactobacillus jinshanensis]QBP18403.1 C69 family dipeptidase [Acetilactobacillus jinshanensis]